MEIAKAAFGHLRSAWERPLLGRLLTGCFCIAFNQVERPHVGG
jgi:hypothetical protein